MSDCSPEQHEELSLPVTSYHTSYSTSGLDESDAGRHGHDAGEEDDVVQTEVGSPETGDIGSDLSSESDNELSLAVTSYHTRYATTEFEEGAQGFDEGESESDGDYNLEPNADEPIADEAWLANYNRERRIRNQRMELLQRRLDGVDSNSTWYVQRKLFRAATTETWLLAKLTALLLLNTPRCDCGNCNIELLRNAKECNCCREIQGCIDALQDKQVLDAVGEKPLSCITQHPGFDAACLNRWSLSLAASQFKTRERKVYQRTGSEER